MTTRVVHCKKEVFDVYIGRPSSVNGFAESPFGNPFRIDRHDDRLAVIRAYETWILGQPELIARLPELKGKRLGCFCAPLPCHGDVLVRLADALDSAQES